MSPRLVVISALIVGGCTVLRPVGESIHTRYPEVNATAGEDGSRCLLVLLPGIGDPVDRFEHHGFVAAVRQTRPGCDLALVDAHFTYYVTQHVVERISNDVLRDARRRGYARVWLVGVSLGGYGAMLTARAHPELVDGVVLIAPMIGVPPREDDVAREVAASGGLLRWPGPSSSTVPRHHFREPRLVWGWLREMAASPALSRRVVLAYGTEDRRADRYDLLARALPANQVFSSPGAHDWPTWRRLWRRVLSIQPWNAPSGRT